MHEPRRRHRNHRLSAKRGRMRQRSSDGRHHAKRSMGQNFLIDRGVIDRILRAADVQPGDIVIEIGPGQGALTSGLIESGAQVTAIELDRDLIGPLEDKFGSHSNFHIIESDVLELDLAAVVGDEAPAKLVANLPYNISTAILQNLIEARGLFSQMVLMFQREVAERIVAPAGSTERGFLTVLVEAVFNVEHVIDVPPGSFRPPPKIWSSVVKLTPSADPIEPLSELRNLASAAFAQKRKTILNNLKLQYSEAAAMLEAAEIDPKRRAETLDRDEWRRLTEVSAGFPRTL